MWRFKRPLAFLLVFALIFPSLSSLVFATDGILVNEETSEFLEENKPGYMERAIAGVIGAIVKFVVSVFKLSDPVVLVFGKDPRVDQTSNFLTEGVYGTVDRDDLVLGTFPEPFFKGIAVLYDAFDKLLPIPLVLALVILSMIFMLNSGTSEGRNKQKDYIRAFVVAVVALRLGPYLWQFIFNINHFLIDWIWAHMMDAGVAKGFFMDMVWGKGNDGLDNAVSIGSLPMVALLLVAAFMLLTLNYQYTMRMIILGVLIIIFPIVVTLSIFPAFRHSFTTWMQEFVANTVVQLAHAIALAGFFLTVSLGSIGQGGLFWIMLAYLLGMSSIVNLVRQMVGLQGGNSAMSSMGSMMGLMAIMNMGRMLKGNKSAGGGGETTSGDTGGGDPAPSGGLGGGAGGKLSGAASGLGKIAQGGFNAAKAVATNPIAQKAARFGIGATAATTGAVLSTMATGNPMMGAAAGMAVGGLANKGLGKVASAAGGGIQNIGESLSGGGSIGDIIQNKAMSGEGGGITKAMANVGWGLQGGINKINDAYDSAFGNVGDINKATPTAGGYFSQHRTNLLEAQQGMAEIQPKYQESTARYEEMKASYGKGSEWYANNTTRDEKTGKITPPTMPKEYTQAEQNYNKDKATFEGHKATALSAQASLKDFSQLKAHMNQEPSYSARRGQI